LSEITVQTYKYDGKPHRTWKAQVTEQKDDLLVLLGIFDRDISHPQLGNIAAGTLSYEYYWLGRWYNVFRFHEPDGTFRNFYCNINMPPKFDGKILSYIDLDIDVFVAVGSGLKVLDLDEFESNSALYSYPPDVIEKAYRTLDELKEMIEN